MRYYRLIDDVEAPGRWWLKSPCDTDGNLVNADVFTVAKKISLATPLRIPLRHDGIELDFTFGAFDMPVLNRRTFRLLEEFLLDGFQSFSAQVENHELGYEVVNFLECRQCVDESQSEFLKWGESDGRLDKIGQYRQITKLRIDPSLVQGLEVFRIEGWRIALIVSENIRSAFEDKNISGIRFLPVS